VRDTRVYVDTFNAPVDHYYVSNDLEDDIIVEATDGRWGHSSCNAAPAKLAKRQRRCGSLRPRSTPRKFDFR
jgi:hypothetical protein